MKPSGPLCNLDCIYCFYKRKAKVVGRPLDTAMSDEVLETFVRTFIEARRGQRITFYWQGGEPTLAGRAFFEKAVALQRRYAPAGTRVDNAIQTNGTLLDDDWCGFLAENGFLVGLSLDGPAELHDRYRRDRAGRPSHMAVEEAFARLRRHGAAVNTLTVVSRANAARPRAVYAYLKGLGATHMQFIPLVERSGPGTLAPPSKPGPEALTVAEYCPAPEAYGAFMCGVFDDWLAHDVETISVQTFDAILARYLGLPGGPCTFGATCGDVMVLEWDGAVYSCDHFVYPEYRIGNIRDASIGDLFKSRAQRRFGLAKRAGLPRRCRRCPVLRLCNGGCPKHRFRAIADGAGGPNYLCAGYRMLFGHTREPLRQMAAELRHARSTSALPGAAGRRSVPRRTGRNDACPCGSGHKFKKCCGEIAGNQHPIS